MKKTRRVLAMIMILAMLLGMAGVTSFAQVGDTCDACGTGTIVAIPAVPASFGIAGSEEGEQCDNSACAATTRGAIIPALTVADCNVVISVDNTVVTGMKAKDFSLDEILSTVEAVESDAKGALVTCEINGLTLALSDFCVKNHYMNITNVDYIFRNCSVKDDGKTYNNDDVSQWNGDGYFHTQATVHTSFAFYDCDFYVNIQSGSAGFAKAPVDILFDGCDFHGTNKYRMNAWYLGDQFGDVTIINCENLNRVNCNSAHHWDSASQNGQNSAKEPSTLTIKNSTFVKNYNSVFEVKDRLESQNLLVYGNHFPNYVFENNTWAEDGKLIYVHTYTATGTVNSTLGKWMGSSGLTNGRGGDFDTLDETDAIKQLWTKDEYCVSKLTANRPVFGDRAYYIFPMEKPVEYTNVIVNHVYKVVDTRTGIETIVGYGDSDELQGDIYVNGTKMTFEVGDNFDASKFVKPEFDGQKYSVDVYEPDDKITLVSSTLWTDYEPADQYRNPEEEYIRPEDSENTEGTETEDRGNYDGAKVVSNNSASSIQSLASTNGRTSNNEITIEYIRQVTSKTPKGPDPKPEPTPEPDPEIEEPETPLGPAPEIEEEDVPMAALPQTGLDWNGMMALIFTGLGLSLAGVLFFTRKRTH